MKLDGFAVQYLLAKEFDDVVSRGLSHKATFDFPILYDVTADMSGHIVLVPAHERPSNDGDMRGTLCICVNEESGRSAREAGAAVVQIKEELLFQHLYNRMQYVFVENERLDAQLRALVDTYAGFQPMLDACTQAVGYSCALIDNQYRMICRSFEDQAAESPVGRERHSGAVADVLEPDSVDMFMAAGEYRYMRASRSAFAVPNSANLMMKNVFSEGQLVGAILMEHRGDTLSARYVRFLLNYLGSFVEEAYNRIGSFGVFSMGAERVKVAIQSVLTGDAAGHSHLEAALFESGHAVGCEYVVLRVERSFTNEGAEEGEYLARRLELAWPYGYCFADRGVLFMLVDASEGEHGDRKSFSKELPIVARENLAKVGISRRFKEMRDFNAALAQARIALQRGSREDPTSWCYRFEDYAFSWLASEATGGLPAEFVCHPAVTTLSRYDERHGSELLHTLSTFMKHRYNATAAASELFVARSTLLHRLARIEELTKIGLDDFSERTYLALSLAMLDRIR